MVLKRRILRDKNMIILEYFSDSKNYKQFHDLKDLFE